ncbi:MAG: hypothetical protein OXU68_04130 [Bacteroidota bacterium]|nr:hypothetical protein [Bacteroidota bacterium]
MKNVTRMTPDVIVVLLSRIKDPKFTYSAPTAGNVPRNSVTRDMLAESDLYSHVSTRTRVDPPRHGRITQRSGDLVAAKEAAALIQAVDRSLTMTTSQRDGIEATAIECTTNTREHASGSDRKGTKGWWFSACCNPETQRSQFAFVDLGIGIFKSLESKHILRNARLPLKTGSASRYDLLRARLAGPEEDGHDGVQRRSGTEQGYRGGLPNMKTRNMRSEMRQLVIVSNNVHADVERNEFQQLEHEFAADHYMLGVLASSR